MISRLGYCTVLDKYSMMSWRLALSWFPAVNGMSHIFLVAMMGWQDILLSCLLCLVGCLDLPLDSSGSRLQSMRFPKAFEAFLEQATI